ncbi:MULTISPECIES: hypothetical protein [Haloprofundus]|uniref:hypothetical protein n=1 Tax=Haloprofundus TaxID=1911573 RepID=UPI000E44E812|nr:MULTISPECIES: hypothetical protein [Haloprofundus]QCJ47165.1 hypothetical protein FCF25_08575 [Haloprofundus sp. MHR1]
MFRLVKSVLRRLPLAAFCAGSFLLLTTTQRYGGTNFFTGWGLDEFVWAARAVGWVLALGGFVTVWLFYD